MSKAFEERKRRAMERRQRMEQERQEQDQPPPQRQAQPQQRRARKAPAAAAAAPARPESATARSSSRPSSAAAPPAHNIFHDKPAVSPTNVFHGNSPDAGPAAPAGPADPALKRQVEQLVKDMRGVTGALSASMKRNEDLQRRIDYLEKQQEEAASGGGGGGDEAKRQLEQLQARVVDLEKAVSDLKFELKKRPQQQQQQQQQEPERRSPPPRKPNRKPKPEPEPEPEPESLSGGGFGGGGGGYNDNDIDEQPLPAASAAAPEDEIPIGGSGADAFEVDEFGDAPETFPCPNCERRFNKKALQRHVKLKVCKKKRKAFKVKVVEEEVPADAKRAAKKFEKEKAKKAKETPKWKIERDRLRQAMMAGKQIAQAQKEGKDLSSLPPPAASTVPDDRTPCPHCGRKFNEDAAKRHIPRCADAAKRTKQKKKK